MPTYIAHVDVDEAEYQNLQELVNVWGTIREDIERLDGEILQTYAVLGEYDFHVMFRVDGSEAAFQASQVMESHGLDTKTMEALPIDRLGELVEDI